jgi:hypothetical protein
MSRLSFNQNGVEKHLRKVQNFFYAPTKAAAIRKAIYFTAENFPDVEKLRNENKELHKKIEIIINTLNHEK